MYGFNFGSRYRIYYCLNFIYKQKIRSNRRLAKVSDYLLLVEMAVIETASENSFSELSTSVGYLLRFPRRTADKQAVRFGIL